MQLKVLKWKCINDTKRLKSTGLHNKLSSSLKSLYILCYKEQRSDLKNSGEGRDTLLFLKDHHGSSALNGLMGQRTEKVRT